MNKIIHVSVEEEQTDENQATQRGTLCAVSRVVSEIPDSLYFMKMLEALIDGFSRMKGKPIHCRGFTITLDPTNKIHLINWGELENEN